MKLDWKTVLKLIAMALFGSCCALVMAKPGSDSQKLSVELLRVTSIAGCTVAREGNPEVAALLKTVLPQILETNTHSGSEIELENDLNALEIGQYRQYFTFGTWGIRELLKTSGDRMDTYRKGLEAVIGGCMDGLK